MKTILCLLMALCFAAPIQAQNPISKMMVYVKPSLQQATGSNAPLGVSKVQETQIVITLSDTVNITAFTVKLGSTQGGTDIIQKTFTYATEGEFQDGTSYTRDGLTVRITLGQHPAITHYYAEVAPAISGVPQQATTFHN